ncbi:MAG: hypothetical protein HY321_19835 [Armatimonadetes bacterium]|nr:hypothetical protein [Armatimonadota bacterium]
MQRRNAIGRFVTALLLGVAAVGPVVAGPMLGNRPRPQLVGRRTFSLTEVHRRIYGRADEMIRGYQTESMRTANQQFESWRNAELARGSASYEANRAPSITQVRSRAGGGDSVADLDENGRPNDPVLITGQGFTPECEVRFFVKAGKEYTVRPPASMVKADVILVRVPDYDATVVSDEVRGKITVVKGSQSSEKPFIYRKPRRTWQVISTRIMPEGDEVAQPTEGGEGVEHTKAVHQSTVIYVTHAAGSANLRTNDWFWHDVPLANGWFRKAVVFEVLDKGNQAYATNENWTQNLQDKTTISIDWNVPANGWVAYALCQIVEGPPGLPYKQ